jgi:starch synthase (maltosyl-transferring)
VNQIRREHPALHRLGNIRFLRADNDNMLLYAKATHDYSDILVVAVNVNPFETHEGPIEFPLDEWGIPEDQNFEVRDLLNDYRSLWRGRHHYLRIDPYLMPAMIFNIRRFSHRENDFDYYV